PRFLSALDCRTLRHITDFTITFSGRKKHAIFALPSPSPPSGDIISTPEFIANGPSLFHPLLIVSTYVNFNVANCTPPHLPSSANQAFSRDNPLSLELRAIGLIASPKRSATRASAASSFPSRTSLP